MNGLRLRRSSWPWFVPAVLAAAAAALGGALWMIGAAREQAVEEAGLAAARAAANEALSVRAFYSGEIALRARKAGMRLSHDFKGREGFLPGASTLMKDLGERVARDHPGFELRLVSRHPFRHRAAPQLDDFEQQALARLEANPAVPQHRIEHYQGRLSVRYAVAEVMKRDCVACHYSHDESPKTDWKVGDVRGMVEVIAPVDVVDRSTRRSARIIGAAVIAGFLLLAGALLAATRRRASHGEAAPA